MLSRIFQQSVPTQCLGFPGNLHQDPLIHAGMDRRADTQNIIVHQESPGFSRAVSSEEATISIDNKRVVHKAPNRDVYGGISAFFL